MLLKKLLGKRIQQLRKENKMTQEQLAEIIDISVRNLSKIENGVNFPSEQTMEKLLRAFKMFPHELFWFNNQELDWLTPKT